jgi:hypothetical protein
MRILANATNQNRIAQWQKMGNGRRWNASHTNMDALEETLTAKLAVQTQFAQTTPLTNDSGMQRENHAISSTAKNLGGTHKYGRFEMEYKQKYVFILK